MAIILDRSIAERKEDLLLYFRTRAKEYLKELEVKFAERDYKKKASAINPLINKSREILVSEIYQKSKSEKWANNDILTALLMIAYTNNVVMLETRNSIRPYEYMDFSRRIGEIWEPFCKLCFDYPSKPLERFTPPLFLDFQTDLEKEIHEYIAKLKITQKQKDSLKSYYQKVWTLVDSGAIKLELDLHFKSDNTFFNIDFKSGFGSNEKGNTNRLLMVATIYSYFKKHYKCVLLVRSNEDQNNSYFQTLKNSSVWEAFCGEETYSKILEFTGFDLKNWMNSYMNWETDIAQEAMKHFKENKIDRYLIW